MFRPASPVAAVGVYSGDGGQSRKAYTPRLRGKKAAAAMMQHTGQRKVAL
ncbi:MAG TPA: hypothetical protein VEZ52_08710 [Desulfovibrio sp.]|nr:hypothetical protein [Desulfovibrio sp.]HZF61687.1 hypothetical protein [Desulfovibrio sp.]